MARKPDWRIVTGSRDKLGEGVLWNAATEDLFWVDFYGPTLHRLSSDGKRRDWSFPQFSNVGSLAFLRRRPAASSVRSRAVLV
jgi:sugar lactone lactonase YvrE